MLRTLLQAIDPRQDFRQNAPRAFLLALHACEYAFKWAGWFLVVSIFVGLSLTICTQNPVFQLLPFFLIVLLFFHASLTIIGNPLFFLVGRIENTIVRRLFAWLLVLLIFALTVFLVDRAPFFELLEVYVAKLFPNVTECKDSIFD